MKRSRLIAFAACMLASLFALEPVRITISGDDVVQLELPRAASLPTHTIATTASTSWITTTTSGVAMPVCVTTAPGSTGTQVIAYGTSAGAR